MQHDTQRMKTNFDRLESAGLVAGVDTSSAIKAKAEVRIKELHALVGKIEKVEAHLSDLYVLSKPARLTKLTQVLNAVKTLHATSLPVGAKKHVGNCLNELVSLREGVYASNAQVDKKALTLIAASKAKQEIKALVTVAEARMDKVMAESTHSSDLDDFYKRAESVIEKHANESEKLSAIQNKAFVIARVPVVPADGAVSVDKLARLGFSVESLGGYAVIHNQIVIGINPKFLLGEGAGGMKGEKAATAIRDEANRLRLLVQKQMKVKLQFVAVNGVPFGPGTWYWLMTDTDINAFARAFPGSHVKVTRWGMAFN